MYIIYFSVLITNIYLAQTAILLWSNKQLNISPLQEFTDTDFENLLENLDNPDVYIFKNPSNDLSPSIRDVIHNYYSAYNPNGNINFENATGTDYLNGLLSILTIFAFRFIGK